MTNQTFILDEKHNLVPVDLMTWAKWFENTENRRVAFTKVGNVEISTVFMGLDHNFGDGPPLLYETMMFRKSRGDEQRRYATWDEAVAGHKRFVRKLKKQK